MLQNILQILVQNNLLSYEFAVKQQQRAAAHGLNILEYLTAHHVLPIKLMTQTLANHFGFEYIDLDTIDTTTLPKLSIPTTDFTALPLRYDTKFLYVAIADPSVVDDLQPLAFQTGLQIIPLLAELDKLVYLRELVLQTNTDNFSVVTFIQSLLHHAVQLQASDIHFEIGANNYRIRFREQGHLIERYNPNASYAERITLHFKILAELDIAEHRKPQEGRFSFKSTPEQSINCRVSICPTAYGEKIVIRLLNARTPLAIEDLPFNKIQRTAVLHALAQTNGIILVTGPTGSGKTTTLYAALNHLNNTKRNITTIEDPIEIILPGVNQIAVNNSLELTFNKILIAILRQDPDIIMLGEMRDLETASTAIDAALTGHLVLSTLHTSGSAETITRLIRLGIKTFDLVDAVRLIIAQRLVRQLCPFCKIAQNITKGCDDCNDGYIGRKAVFEVMNISPAIKNAILARHDTTTIRNIAIQEGMITLYQAGMEQLNAHTTTIDEILPLCS